MFKIFSKKNRTENFKGDVLSIPDEKTSEYAKKYLRFSTLEVRGRYFLDFHEVSAADVRAMMNRVAFDTLGRELTESEIEELIHAYLWREDEETDEPFKLDFHDVEVVAVRKLIEAIPQL